MTEKSNNHFATVEQNKTEPWRTEIYFGIIGNKRHGHIGLSGTTIIYCRTEEGEEIIKGD